MSGVAPAQSGGKLGRYELHGAIARGGMATVYVARMSGAAGFARTVAIKRLHPHLAADPTFSAMFIDEARLAARIRHPNVIDTLDVVADGGELFLVMDFVLGETMAKLAKETVKRGITLPAPVVSSMVIGALEGLHAAHEATNERGEPLGIVHRDISPQNILIARDGVARVLDFGVAKAAGRVQETEGGEIKGKLAYMAPEQLTRKSIDRRCDIFAMGIVLWEALTSKRLFAGDDAASTLYAVMNEEITPPSRIVRTLPPELDAVVLKALERDADKRYASAQEMAMALEAACPPAPTRHVGKWVEDLAADALKTRSEIVRAIDHHSGNGPISVPVDEMTGSLALASSAFVSGTAATEPFHVPSGPMQPVDSGLYGISTITRQTDSGVTSPSGVSNTSAMSNVTHTHTMPIAPARTASDQNVKLAIIGGVFAAIAIIGIIMTVIAIRARQQAAYNAALASASVVSASTAPPPTPRPDATAPTTPKPVQSAPVAAAPPDAGSPAVAPVVTAPTTPVAIPIRPNPGPRPTAKPADDCKDPFTIGADGIRRPKIQCLGK